MTLAQRIGVGLKALRTACGVSQAMLAEWIGVEPETISRYERAFRAPRLDTIEVLLNALDSSPELFFVGLFIGDVLEGHPDVHALVIFAFRLSALEARSVLPIAQIHVTELRRLAGGNKTISESRQL